MLVQYNKTLDITSADESIIVAHDDLMSNSTNSSALDNNSMSLEGHHEGG